MANTPLTVNTLKTHQYNDTSQTNVSSEDWAWETNDIQRARGRFSFIVHPQKGLWHYARGAVRPATDRGMVIVSGTNRLTSFDDVTLKAASTTGAHGPHKVEYASTGEDVDKVCTYASSSNRAWLAPPAAISGEWWMIHLYVLMPGRSLVKSGFNGWELRHGTSGRRVQAFTNPEYDEPVPLSLTILHQATSTANIPITFNLYYTHDGTQVTNPKDACTFHRFSMVRVKDGRA